MLEKKIKLRLILKVISSVIDVLIADLDREIDERTRHVISNQNDSEDYYHSY